MENTNTDERYFDLGIILSITCGYLFTDMDNIYDILSYITNTDVNVYNVLYSLRVAEFCILQRYPQLRNIDQNIQLRSNDEIADFVNKQKQLFGESLALSPISKERSDSSKRNGR